MTLFTKLDDLISSQDRHYPTSSTLLANLGVPSTSVAVLDDGVISSHCFSSVNDNEDTVFQACSISKPVTCMAIMKLIDQGKLQLESRIVDLLPEDIMEILTNEASANRKTMIENITVKQLLSHTSGLSTGGFPGYSVLNHASIPTAHEILGGKGPTNTMRVRLEGIPGHSFSYSGGGLTVVQLILETITGKDFATLMHDTVLGPLNMTRSSYRPLSPDETNSAKAYYTGYTPCEDEQRVNPEQAAAGLWTTPTDLLKVIRAVQESLENADNTGFIQQATAKCMLTEEDSGMALSWLAPRDPGTMFSHSGSNNPGWRCWVGGFADLVGRGDSGVPRNRGVAVMTNSAVGDDVVWKVTSAVAYLKGWIGIPRMSTYPAMIPFHASGRDLNEQWRDWIGSWSDGRSILAIEAHDKDAPTIRLGDETRMRLLAAAIPNSKYTGKQHMKSFNAIVDGLGLLFRFGVAEDERTLEMWNGGSGKITQLHRVDQFIRD
ncbi:hypothetical protein QQX98_004909 [Neonectria punicea]|uniref:Beta-lactamase-related domain-containing protein n=1 Tax=Neonectria punicea TaxID=979145 RepID=A0ABR1H8F3_9HYPO